MKSMESHCLHNASYKEKKEASSVKALSKAKKLQTLFWNTVETLSAVTARVFDTGAS